MPSLAPPSIPYPPRSTGLVWHYTDEVGLRGILRSNRLWASPPTALNDTGEYTYGLKRISELWAHDRAGFFSSDPGAAMFIDQVLASAWEEPTATAIYISCASSAGDSLSQWRGYAGTSGFAIGIRIDSNLWFGAPDRIVDGPMNGISMPYWFEVVYEPRQQDELIRSFFRWLSLMPLSMRESSALWTVNLGVSPLPALLKHNGFRDEREVRWIGPELSPVSADTHPSSKRHLLVGAYALSSGEVNLSRLPVVEVQCGPTCGPDVEANVLQWLAEAGHDHVAVSRSRIPFR